MPKRLASGQKWQANTSAKANASRVLPEMAREYFAAGRKIVAAKPDPAELHPFRLKTKQIRYTLEGFSALYGEPMDALLARLKPVQDALGEVNDAVATRAEFDVSGEFKKFLKHRARSKAKEFFAAWRETFDLPGEEEKWVEQLRGKAAKLKPD